MCQAYEGERQFVIACERREIEEKWRRHKSGEQILSADELKDLAIQKIMLSED